MGSNAGLISSASTPKRAAVAWTSEPSSSSSVTARYGAEWGTKRASRYSVVQTKAGTVTPAAQCSYNVAVGITGAELGTNAAQC